MYNMWNIEEETGYKPITTFWQDFSIADPFGKDAIEDTFMRAKEEWKDNYKFMTELSLVMNWKSWQYQYNQNMCELYADLYYKIDAWFYGYYKDNQEALNYYFKTTD